MSTATRRRAYPFAVRGPLGPWAVWVRQEREDHGWSEADLGVVLWGEASDSHVRQVRRWEAGHWGPNDDACQRLVSAFGTTPPGIDIPVPGYARDADEWVPARAAIADAVTTARTSWGFDPDHDIDALHALDDMDAAGRSAGAIAGDVVDLSDLDLTHTNALTDDLPEDVTQDVDDDGDGWEL